MIIQTMCVWVYSLYRDASSQTDLLFFLKHYLQSIALQVVLSRLTDGPFIDASKLEIGTKLHVRMIWKPCLNSKLSAISNDQHNNIVRIAGRSPDCTFCITRTYSITVRVVAYWKHLVCEKSLFPCGLSNRFLHSPILKARGDRLHLEYRSTNLSY